MRPKLIWIEWLDATFISSNWKGVEGLSSIGCHLESVGFLIKEDKRGVYIATDSDPDDRGRARGVSFIPRGMIKRRKVFTVK